MPPVWFWKKLPVCVFVIVRSGGPLIRVRSLAVSFVVSVSPPPETVAMLVSEAGAFGATFTVTAMGKVWLPTGNDPTLVQVSVATVQIQLAPVIAVAVIPTGNVSVTVMVPLVGPPPVFFTTML